MELRIKSGNDRASDFDTAIFSMSSSTLTGSVDRIRFDLQSDDAANLNINGGATSTSRQKSSCRRKPIG